MRMEMKAKWPSRAGPGWLAAMLLATVMTAGCQQPKVELRDLRVINVGPQKVWLVLDYTVKNTNTTQLNIWGLEYSLQSDGIRLAESTLTSGMAIESGAIGRLRVPLEIEHAQMAKLWESAGDVVALPYEFTGKLTYRLFGVPLDMTITHAGFIPRIEPPNWTFRLVRKVAGEDNLLELVFDVDNPNSFGLPLATLSGVLKMEDVSVLTVDRSNLPFVEACQHAALVVPVRVYKHKAGRVAAMFEQIEKHGKAPTFAGELRFGLPDSAKQMLMGAEPEQ